jgi:hypothetical protein
VGGDLVPVGILQAGNPYRLWALRSRVAGGHAAKATNRR